MLAVRDFVAPGETESEGAEPHPSRVLAGLVLASLAAATDDLRDL